MNNAGKGVDLSGKTTESAPFLIVRKEIKKKNKKVLAFYGKCEYNKQCVTKECAISSAGRAPDS